MSNCLLMETGITSSYIGLERPVSVDILHNAMLVCLAG